ncbi:MAG: DNA polymerase IV [Pseudomonadales bacterium]|nr:DNA polymerase IV [Pseudomonadales bacterium]
MDAWPRIVLHADMDAFYAAVEQRENPDLRGKPVLIGPNSHRGVVLTASYEARPYGVGSAMPVAEARRRCPQAVMVPPNFELYQSISQQVMDIFADFSPYVEAISLDEAFIDMTGATHFFGAPAEMGRKIKEAVYDATDLHISVGVSSTKYVAKVASAHDKPNGLTVVPPSHAKDWLAPQPIRRLWGVGKKTGPKLEALGLYTIGDIADAEPEYLSHHLGQSGAHFYNLAHARDPRRVTRGRTAKSIGSDRTLSKDVSHKDDIVRHLHRSAERIARRVRAKGYVANGLRVRLKTTEFEMLTRQRKFSKPADTATEFLKLATTLLDEFDHPGPFRLVGMTAFDLDWQDEANQLDLFETGRDRDLELTLDEVTKKFGSDTVVRARDMTGHGTVSKNGVNLDYLDFVDGERVSSPGGAD